MPDSIDVMDTWGDLPDQEPGTDRPAEQVAWQLRWQARACWHLGSALYGDLLERAAADVEAGGACWGVLAGHVAPGRGDALALRFMAAVHRLVLTGRAPALAAHYPSAGGSAAAEEPGAAAWPAFRAAVEEHAGHLRDDVARPCQTNEVGRAAGLAAGFLQLAGLGLPLRLREIGASGGLNLRWDHFRYGGGGAAWGPPGSPVDLTGHWAEAPPVEGAEVSVVERAGCDLQPLDPTSEDGRLMLRSSLWADQLDRLERIEGAMGLAAQVPATVERASADDWLADTLAPQEGTVTVAYHSVFEEYLPDAVRLRVDEAVAAAGARATASSPVARLRLEPLTALRSHGVALTVWPGGEERALATCGAHGTNVRWRRGAVPAGG